jgi:hypothetical protein
MKTKEEVLSDMNLNFSSAEEADDFEEGSYYLLKSIAIGIRFIIEQREDKK